MDLGEKKPKTISAMQINLGSICDTKAALNILF